MKIKIFTTGGTIDKVYFDALSEFQVGESTIGDLFREANVAFDYDVETLLKKDSLDLTDDDRKFICNRVIGTTEDHILVTHGTDTMAATASVLADTCNCQSTKTPAGKTIVLTGSMQPARLKFSDADFNVGFAMAALQTLTPGVYIAMNGSIFSANNVKKNKREQRFEKL